MDKSMIRHHLSTFPNSPSLSIPTVFRTFIYTDHVLGRIFVVFWRIPDSITGLLLFIQGDALVSFKLNPNRRLIGFSCCLLPIQWWITLIYIISSISILLLHLIQFDFSAAHPKFRPLVGGLGLCIFLSSPCLILVEVPARFHSNLSPWWLYFGHDLRIVGVVEVTSSIQWRLALYVPGIFLPLFHRCLWGGALLLLSSKFWDCYCSMHYQLFDPVALRFVFIQFYIFVVLGMQKLVCVCLRYVFTRFWKLLNFEILSGNLEVSLQNL